jgi:hypothetical protein
MATVSLGRDTNGFFRAKPVEYQRRNGAAAALALEN